METKVEQYKLSSEKIKTDRKIALISDFHLKFENDSNYLKSILSLLDTITPNIIALAGDYYSGYSSNRFIARKELVKILHALRERAPIVMSMGNHDLDGKNEEFSRKEFESLEDRNIYPLNNNGIVIGDIYFSGFLARKDAYAVGKILPRKSNMILKDLLDADIKSHPNLYSILLSHIPDIVVNSNIKNNYFPLYDFDLILAGHHHNGSLTDKSEQKLIDLCNYFINRFKKKDANKYRNWIDFLEKVKKSGFVETTVFNTLARGLHEINDTKLIVSKGIIDKGMISKKESYITEIQLESTLLLKQ